MLWITQKQLALCKHPCAQSRDHSLGSSHGIFRPEICQWWRQKPLSTEKERKSSVWGFCRDTNHSTKNDVYSMLGAWVSSRSLPWGSQRLWKPLSEPNTRRVEGSFLLTASFQHGRGKHSKPSVAGRWRGFLTRLMQLSAFLGSSSQAERRLLKEKGGGS